MHAHVPMDRLGEQTEMAELIAFLASGKCNFVNGQEIAFTGGWPGVLGFPAPMPKRDVQP
jgi:NAD(P)-dependent dehydrogenase (short-subunit alcohol dehydrogenase family)